MTSTTYAFALFALLVISFVAANDPTQNEIKADGANQVIEEQQYDGGYGGGRGGYGGGYGGGRGGYGGGRGGYGGGYGGGRGGYGGGYGGGHGGYGGGHYCRWGRCCGGGGYYGGGCRCCYTAQEALAYMQNIEANP